MLGIKWLLLIVTLLLGLEVDSKSFPPRENQNTGVQCEPICKNYSFTGLAALCHVLYKNNIKVLVGRNPSFSYWKFYPVSARDQLIIMKDQNALCERIAMVDIDYERTCFDDEDESQEQYYEDSIENDEAPNLSDFGYQAPQYYPDFNSFTHGRQLVEKLERAVGKVLRQFQSNGKRSDSVNTADAKDLQEISLRMEEIKEAINSFQHADNGSSPASLQLDHEALQTNISSYTPDEWEKLMATLTKIRDDVRDGQPNSEELSFALDKIFPILNAITILREKKSSLINLRFLDLLVNIVEDVSNAPGASHHGNAPLFEISYNGNDNSSKCSADDYYKKQKEAVIEDLNLQMEKVKEEVANGSVEVPPKLIDEIDKEVKRWSSAMSSSESEKPECTRCVINLIKDIIKLISEDKEYEKEHGTGKDPASSVSTTFVTAPSPIDPYGEKNHSPDFMCQAALSYLCENRNVMIYTSHNSFCLTKLRSNHPCDHKSKNCTRDLNYLLQHTPSMPSFPTVATTQSNNPTVGRALLES